jgi:hypothetical protein
MVLLGNQGKLAEQREVDLATPRRRTVDSLQLSTVSCCSSRVFPAGSAIQI